MQKEKYFYGWGRTLKAVKAVSDKFEEHNRKVHWQPAKRIYWPHVKQLLVLLLNRNVDNVFKLTRTEMKHHKKILLQNWKNVAMKFGNDSRRDEADWCGLKKFLLCKKWERRLLWGLWFRRLICVIQKILVEQIQKKILFMLDWILHNETSNIYNRTWCSIYL